MNGSRKIEPGKLFFQIIYNCKISNDSSNFTNDRKIIIS